MKNDGKDRYRKKSYAPPKKIKLTESTKAILSCIKKINKKDHERKGLYNILEDLGGKGANLDVIIACLHPMDILSLYSNGGKGLEYVKDAMSQKGIWEVPLLYKKDSQKRDVLTEHSKEVVRWGKNKGGYRSAINRLLNAEPLPEKVHPFYKSFNKELEEAKKKIESASEVFERYIQLKEWLQCSPPLMMRSADGKIVRNPEADYNISVGKPKGKRKQREILQINEKIKILFEEINRIGYAKKSACEITAKILGLSYPIACKDIDADKVKMSLKYHRDKE